MTPGPALVVDTDDPTPPYEQLRRQLVDLMRAGVLAPGTRLPPLRQLAADLGLAVGTVGRTYRELEAAGLIATRRGAGTRVQAVPRAPGVEQRPALDVQAEHLVQSARRLGLDDAAVRTSVERALAAVRTQSLT